MGADRPGGRPAARRAAVYLRITPDPRRDEDAKLAALRSYARTRGWELAGEFLDRGKSVNSASTGWQRLLERAGGKDMPFDVVLVRSLGEAFSSVDHLTRTRQRLAELGIDFESFSEPWISAVGHVASSQGMPVPAISDELQQTLTRYLERRIAADEREEQRLAESRRREAIQTEVGQKVTWLLLLVGYALLLGVVSRPVLISALLDPGELVRRLAEAGTGLGVVTGAVPEALRGFLYSAVGTLALLLFRAASFNVRSDIGGALFIGFVAVALLGLSASASSGLVGALAALPGFAAAALVIYEFVEMLRRLERSGLGRRARRESAFRRLVLIAGRGRPLQRARGMLDPTSSAVATVALIGFPVVSLFTLAAAVLTNGGPLFWAGRSALIGFAVWCLWACYVTPHAIRIPLWSMLAWAGLFLTLFAFGSVSVIFAVAVIVLLVGNVAMLTLRRM